MDGVPCRTSLGAMPLQVLALSKALQKSNASLRACHVSLRGTLDANTGVGDENAVADKTPKKIRASKETARRAAALVRRGENVRRGLDSLREDALHMRETIAAEMAHASDALTARIRASAEETAQSHAEARRERDALTAKWRASVKERRRVMEQLSSLRGSIRVLCRLKPIMVVPSERHRGRACSTSTTSIERDNECECAVGIDANDDEETVSVRNHERSFGFDGVLGPKASNDDVFAEVEAMVEGVLDGYRASVLAYGQTGAGKTFTMLGTDTAKRSTSTSTSTNTSRSSSSDGVGANATDLGIIGRSLLLLFQSSRDRQENDGYRYTFTLTALEVYNDSVIDLLADENHDSAGEPMHSREWGHRNAHAGSSSTGSLQHARRASSMRHKLDVRCDSHENTFYAHDITEVKPSTFEDAVEAVKRAIATRRTSCTSSNDLSSRSHCVISITVSGISPDFRKLSGRLALVDLAGSERLDRSGAVGDVQVEAININKSLTSLSDVMMALQQQSSISSSSSAAALHGHAVHADTKKVCHVPYRNSTLTKLLSTTLCRNAKCVLIVNVSSSQEDTKESICSMSFGERARRVALGKAKRATSAFAASGGSGPSSGTSTPISKKKSVSMLR